jgi:alpha-glucoside transport system permease protein
MTDLQLSARKPQQGLPSWAFVALVIAAAAVYGWLIGWVIRKDIGDSLFSWSARLLLTVLGVVSVALIFASHLRRLRLVETRGTADPANSAILTVGFVGFVTWIVLMLRWVSERAEADVAIRWPGNTVTGTLFSIVVGLGGFGLIFLVLYVVFEAFPKELSEKLRALPFVLTALLFAIGGLFVSAVGTVVQSFKDDTTGKEWVGLENYQGLWEDSGIRLSMVNTALWVFVGTAITVGMGLLIARFSDGMKFESIAKTLVFLPVAISLVGAGITWKFIYAERGFFFQAGMLNTIARNLGLPKSLGGGEEGRNWILERGAGGLTPPDWAPGFNSLLLIVIFIWAQTGIATVVLSAAIKGVPQELQEAATVDGATNGEVFRKVTIPYIKGTLATVTSLVALASLKAFDVVAAVTGGNFGTRTLAYEFFQKKFTEGRDGSGAAVAVLLFVLCFPIVVWNRRVQARVEETN